MDDNLKAAQEMYPEEKYLYRTSDDSIHTTAAGAEAQASHLADARIEKIKCKTSKTSSSAGSAKVSPD